VCVCVCVCHVACASRLECAPSVLLRARHTHKRTHRHSTPPDPAHMHARTHLVCHQRGPVMAAHARGPPKARGIAQLLRHVRAVDQELLGHAATDDAPEWGGSIKCAEGLHARDVVARPCVHGCDLWRVQACMMRIISLPVCCAPAFAFMLARTHVRTHKHTTHKHTTHAHASISAHTRMHARVHTLTSRPRPRWYRWR